MSVDTPPAGWRRLLPLKKEPQNTPTSAPEVTLLDPFSGRVEVFSDFPKNLGDENVPGKTSVLSIILRDGFPHLSTVAGDVAINGAPFLGEVAMPVDETITAQLPGRLFFLRAGAKPGWPKDLDVSAWHVFEISTGRLLGQCAPRQIPELIARVGSRTEECAACPQGLDTGFAAQAILDALRFASVGAAMTQAPSGDTGKHFCPACWLRFDSGDALNIASHEELTGDPVLGPEQRLRFHPTRFNDAGIALDPMGLPAPDLACPHCRRQLPQCYLETPHHIISVVGAPGAGKSYLLAVLTRLLQDGLFRDFGVTFRDDDPTGNLMLNQMRSRLFSALNPEDAILTKTALEGAFYERLRRHGRTVAMPRPFVYSIRDKKSKDTSFVFYDNAGEHFEPGLDPESSPGAMHVARSSGLFFLFDPTANAKFRAELAGHSDDPQLTQGGRIDQQDTILAEMDVRIKRVLGLPREQRIKTPVAVLVGKSDVWCELFNACRLPTPVTNEGKLDLSRVNENSDYMRSMLLDLCPGLVGGAESISENVRYFAVSALGHSPAALTEGPKAGMLAPDPKRLKPTGIDHAAYWLISQAVPGVIPTT